MSNDENPQPNFASNMALIDEKIAITKDLAQAMINSGIVLKELFESNNYGVDALVDRITPIMQEISSEQNKLRVLVLRKTDGLQASLDLVREDIRSVWGTADFAISNSRNTREDVDRLLNMLSVMQKQQQLLTSQVDELRKKAAEGENGL